MHASERRKQKKSKSSASLSALAKPTDVLLLTRVFASLSDPSPHTDFVFNFL